MAGNAKRTHKRRIRLLWAVLAILPLALALLSQTVLATTYVITDGDRVVTYTTFATDPDQVLGEAGLELDEGDTYTTEGVMGVASITINRSHTARILYYGEEMEAQADGLTVGQLLHSLNLDLEPEDVVSQPLDLPVEDGMEIRVDKIVTQTQTYTKNVAHDTETYDSAELPRGRDQVLVEGVDGELVCTARVTYVNGEETRREVLSEKLSIAPVTEIRAHGTGADGRQEEPVILDGYIILPTGEVLTYTRKDTVRATAYTHTDAGCDQITATGTTVRKGTVAVDPRFIPYGTRMFIVSNDGQVVYGLCTAEDCGGAIKRDRVDLYYPTYQECMEFGRRSCTIYFLG